MKKVIFIFIILAILLVAVPKVHAISACPALCVHNAEYWANHTDSWWVVNAVNSVFLSSGMTWRQILQNPPTDFWLVLAKPYLAFILNYPPPYCQTVPLFVNAASLRAWELLNQYPRGSVPSGKYLEFIKTAIVLAGFNQGLIPGFPECK